MDESTCRLIRAQQRAQRRMKLNYWAEAADYLLEKSCFSGATLLIDAVEKEAKELEN